MNQPASAESASAPIDQQLVARLFARSERLGAADFLLREVAQRMHERLDLLRLQPQDILDAGAGLGLDALQLLERWPQARALALDLAPQRLSQGRRLLAQQKQAAQSTLGRVFGRWLGGARDDDPLIRVAGDYAALPLRPASLDFLWSNLALHWHARPHRVFMEWRRVLRAQGVLMFSCFGPDSLRQLRSAFEYAGLGQARVLPFVDMHDLGDMLLAAGFADPVLDMEMLTLRWRDPQQMLEEVRALGGNPLANRARGLCGRQAWQRMLQALPRDAEGHYQMQIEIVYGHAFCPQPKTGGTGESVLHFMPRPRS
ncbi:methyltransferase domain-containing protein [Massilia sp. W12]|uniref:methyltransferase domain-containing protein n=1 Tax=Massilia sp. W12 TaxID=3126507 RepID=UPI0030D6071A